MQNSLKNETNYYKSGNLYTYNTQHLHDTHSFQMVVFFRSKFTKKK